MSVTESNLDSVQYIERKLVEWDKRVKDTYTTAYYQGNWDVVNSLTGDLDSSMFYNRMVQYDLYRRIIEGNYKTTMSSNQYKLCSKGLTMSIQEIPKRKMSIRQMVSKVNNPDLRNIIVTEEWMGDRKVAIRRLPEYEELAQQLEYVYGNSGYSVNVDRYNNAVNTITADSNCQVQWEIVGMVDKENPIHIAVVILWNESLKSYTAIPYYWFKFLYDRVSELHLEGTDNMSPIICKDGKRIIGMMKPYRLDWVLYRIDWMPCLRQ